jgi:hypothetical protein
LRARLLQRYRVYRFFLYPFTSRIPTEYMEHFTAYQEQEKLYIYWEPFQLQQKTAWR